MKKNCNNFYFVRVRYKLSLVFRLTSVYSKFKFMLSAGLQLFGLKTTAVSMVKSYGWVIDACPPPTGSRKKLPKFFFLGKQFFLVTSKNLSPYRTQVLGYFGFWGIWVRLS